MRIPSLEIFNIVRGRSLKAPKFELVKDCKIISKLNAIDKMGNPIELKTHFGTEYSRTPCFTTEIFTKDSTDAVGYNTFSISKENLVLNGNSMQVNKELQKKYGYGEVLRLASIIDLLENSLDKISIYALTEAIPFHHKYKFKPNIPLRKDEIEELLIKISRQRNEKLQPHSQTAKKILNELIYCNFGMSNSKYANLTEKINLLVSNYLKATEKNNLNWESSISMSGVSFRTDIDMDLDRNSIYENKDFFNEKFLAHGIDYKI